MSQVGRGGGRGEGEDRGSLLLLCVTPPSLHLLSSDRWSDAAVLHVLRINIYAAFPRSKTCNNVLARLQLSISLS